MMKRANPCLKCGACCAFFRVSFYWAETDLSSAGTVPCHLTEKLSEFKQVMRGTGQKKPYCAALEGKIGDAVHCGIYATRPSPCREFGVLWDEGTTRLPSGDLSRCNRARSAWQLPLLAFHTQRRMAHHLAVRLQLIARAPGAPPLSPRLTHLLRNPKGNWPYPAHPHPSPQKQSAHTLFH